MYTDRINQEEIARVNDLISLNCTEQKPFFEDDIELIKTNPRKYWNSFLLNCKDEYPERYNLILSMQAHYNQLTLF